MKKPYRLFVIIALCCLVISASSCVTTETTVQAPDGTITTTKTSGPDAASVQAASTAVQVIAAK